MIIHQPPSMSRNICHHEPIWTHYFYWFPNLRQWFINHSRSPKSSNWPRTLWLSSHASLPSSSSLPFWPWPASREPSPPPARFPTSTTAWLSLGLGLPLTWAGAVHRRDRRGGQHLGRGIDIAWRPRWDLEGGGHTSERDREARRYKTELRG